MIAEIFKGDEEGLGTPITTTIKGCYATAYNSGYTSEVSWSRGSTTSSGSLPVGTSSDGRVKITFKTPNSSSIYRITGIRLIFTISGSLSGAHYDRASISTKNGTRGSTMDSIPYIASSPLYDSNEKSIDGSTTYASGTVLHVKFTDYNVGFSKNTTYYIYLYHFSNSTNAGNFDKNSESIDSTPSANGGFNIVASGVMTNIEIEGEAQFTQYAYMSGLQHGEGNNSPYNDAYNCGSTLYHGSLGDTFSIQTIISSIPNGFYKYGYWGYHDTTWKSQTGTLTYGVDDVTQELYYQTKYNISYTMNGGTNSSSNPSSYVVTDAFKFVNPVSRTGYTFNGWTKNGTKIEGINVDKIGKSMNVSSLSNFRTDCSSRDTGSITVVANWTAIEYFNSTKHIYTTSSGASSGFLELDSGFYKHYGDTIKVDTGFFYTLPNGFQYRSTYKYRQGTTTFSTGTVGSTVLTQRDSGIEFQYFYDPITYTITYNYDCTDYSVATQTTTYTVLGGVSFKNPTRPGYKFKGWKNKTSGAIITGINEGATIPSVTSESALRTTLASRTTGDITVVAQWEAEGVVYIANSSGKFEAYECYIYNGSSWEKYIPYVYDGGSWHLCG